MLEKRLINRDDLYGIAEFFIPSSDGTEFTIETVQDVTPVLDANKDDLNMVSGTDRWGDGKLVARIPMVIYNDWKSKGYTDDSAKLRQLLNDPDNRFMRIWPGRL